MDNYKLAFIHGKSEMKKNMVVGNIEYIGDSVDDLHSSCLLEYARACYEDITIFKQLSIRHKPEVIGYLFVYMFNDIIFFNTTKNPEKYGYSGMFLLPDNILDEQKKSLFDLASSIDNYEVGIFSSLKLEDGMLVGDEMFPMQGETPREMLNKYFLKQEKDSNNVRK